jgi:hypothetical protein
MYHFINYGKLFEDAESTQPVQTQQLTGKNSRIILTLSDQDQDELGDLLTNNNDLQLFTRPAQIVDKANPDTKLGEINVALAIANSDAKDAQFPDSSSVDMAKTLVLPFFPKQLNIAQLPSPVTIPVQVNPTTTVELSIVGVATQQTTQQTTEEPQMAVSAPEETPEELNKIVATGDMIGADVEKNESSMKSEIKSFDAFIGEAKKKWIGDIDMKKGALKKDLGKEEITAEDIAKVEKKLKAKDKDKKKPGLQLDKKDAKTHKRAVLAKNLMKASGAITESRKEKIKGAKDQLVKIHEVIQKLIDQSKK